MTTVYSKAETLLWLVFCFLLPPLRLGDLCLVLDPEVIKLFTYSTQLSTKFILLINVKMPTIYHKYNIEETSSKTCLYVSVFYFL